MCATVRNLNIWPVGLMDKASASGAGDSRFESWAGHMLILRSVITLDDSDQFPASEPIFRQNGETQAPEKARFEDLSWRERFGIVPKHRQKEVFFEVSQIPKWNDFSKMTENRPRKEPVWRIFAGETNLEF